MIKLCPRHSCKNLNSYYDYDAMGWTRALLNTNSLWVKRISMAEFTMIWLEKRYESSWEDNGKESTITEET